MRMSLRAGAGALAAYGTCSFALADRGATHARLSPVGGPGGAGLKRRSTLGSLAHLKRRLAGAEDAVADARRDLSRISSRLSVVEQDTGLGSGSVVAGDGRTTTAVVEIVPKEGLWNFDYVHMARNLGVRHWRVRADIDPGSCDGDGGGEAGGGGGGGGGTGGAGGEDASPRGALRTRWKREAAEATRFKTCNLTVSVPRATSSLQQRVAGPNFFDLRVSQKKFDSCNESSMA